jgi:predicted RNA-binding Zn-ribbon protein involved in translation (DUF1610 family)
MSREAQAPPTTVTCAHCGQDVIPRAAERDVPGGRLLAFACPKCRFETPFGLLTHRGIRLRERVRAHRAERGTSESARLRRLLAAYRRELRPVTSPPGDPGPRT